jgi:hypothetical protein
MVFDIVSGMEKITNDSPKLVLTADPVATRKVWVAPQVEKVEFVDTQASPNLGGVYDFAFIGTRSF